MKTSVAIKSSKIVKLEETKTKLQALLTAKNGMIVLILVCLFSLGFGMYFYQKANNNPQKIAQQDLEDTIAAVGKLMVLPVGEVPTLATVSDPEKLRDQSFFANAKKDDKVLIYSTAGKAILYNPSSNKIVEVSPLKSR